MKPKFLRNPFIAGTLILTAAGLAGRLIGFFYRIFLSRTIGEEGMGIYQLIFPVFGLFCALCCGCFETAISRFVAAQTSSGRQARYLLAGACLSMAFSACAAGLIWLLAEPISVYILLEERCRPLLRLIALSLPFSGLHACISGYYYGLKKAAVPALSQLLEQIVRVASVFLIWQVALSRGNALTPADAVTGTLLGEAAAVLFLLAALCFHRTASASKLLSTSKEPKATFSRICGLIMVMAFPLMANRLCINLLQSAEAIMIPSQLRVYGCSGDEALALYGVLTGMSMPFILFPSTLTNSVAVMLLPSVAQAQADGSSERIRNSIRRSVHFCLLLGIFCTGIFLLFGNEMGQIVFQSVQAGNFITILAWLCPFLYLGTTLGSILNGLGMTGTTFTNNLLCLLTQLAFVVFLVPRFGILACLWGMLSGELLLAALHLRALRRPYPFSFSAVKSILIPSIVMAVGGAAGKALEYVGLHYTSLPRILWLAAGCLFSCLFYAACLFLPLREKHDSA